MEITLDKLKVNQEAVVKKVITLGAIRRRFYDMGITPGVKILFKKVAPLGDPIQIKLRGYDLSLTKKEAKEIIVEVAEWLSLR